MIKQTNNLAKRLFSPLPLGKITLENRLVQAPLAGYSCAPFRVITQRYGNPGFCTTEMISVNNLLHRKAQQQRYLWRDPEERFVSYQLSTIDSDKLKQACDIVTVAGADIIDLNCGCPVKKIRSKGAGSKLLQQPEKIYQLVRTMRTYSDAAISVKIRIASPLYDSDDFAVAQAIAAAGADLLIVHGRHWTERYDKPCQLDAIARIVNAVNIPVFANGDADSAESVNAILSATHCAGIMIARASVGNPWLFQQIRSELLQEDFQTVNLTKIGNVFLQHINQLVTLENEHLAVLQARKLAKYYARAQSWRHEFTAKIQQANTLSEVTSLIAQYFYLYEEQINDYCYNNIIG